MSFDDITADSLADENQISATHNERSPEASLDCLDSFVLKGLFEKLMPMDRLRAEMVSRRWRRIAKNHSWSSYRSLQYAHFSEDDLDNSQKLLDCLLPRCMQFVQEVNLFGSQVPVSLFVINEKQTWESVLFRALPSLTNLRHLAFDTRRMYYRLFGVAERWPTDWLANIKSLHVMNIMNSCINSLCNRLPNLQVLRLDHNYDFYYPEWTIVPRSLKWVIQSYRETEYQSALLQRAIIDDVSIEYLEMACVLENSNIARFAEYVPTSLCYLTFTIGEDNRNSINGMLCTLIYLRALKITILDPCDLSTANQVLDTIATCMPNLEHLEFLSTHKMPLDGEKIIGLSRLARLSSVSFLFKHKDVAPAICRLFEVLTERGSLKYFVSRSAIPIPILCRAIKSCRGLQTLFCWNRPAVGMDIFDTLDEAHAFEAPPDDPEDERILHLCLGGRNRAKRNDHPWAKFYTDFEYLPPSKVAQRIRDDILRDLPSFVYNVVHEMEVHHW
ncbi:hypothetical protein DdX_15026 [Ditylenchus destructor]|uniref:F-box domain-containing protein n=1 Tax=Ditylenchus destructor TaxID=166010 RepID=A0AAD4MT86_9BILA|nr:hypothetical protein DdX_15026 [Ditylenchus destructor]